MPRVWRAVGKETGEKRDVICEVDLYHYQRVRICSFANNFHQHALSSAAIEFAIEDLLPRTEVQFALGDRDDNLASHNLPFHVRIGIVLAGTVVHVLAYRLVRGELFQPALVILV